MKRYLVSWLAVVNDFNETSDSIPINTQGPTCNFHKYYFKGGGYAKHYILYTTDHHRKMSQMKSYLQTHFKDHAVETVEVQVQKAFEDFIQIRNLSEAFIKKLIDEDAYVDILLSTGSGIMKVAWYICHQNFPERTRLLLIHPPGNGSKPEMVHIQTEEISKNTYHALKTTHLAADSIATPILTSTLQKVYDYARRIALSDHPVLIYGESGTGKELIARFIHQNSSRLDKPFLAFNCSAFTETVLESRLFGHKKGSFTGAHSDQKGIFEEANGGTVFLDEIGDISPAMQLALLRVLQFNEIQPVGGKIKKVNVRVIAATNKPIHDLQKHFTFRTDLFYRFPFYIKLPSLRDYPKDELRCIINELIVRLSNNYNKKIKFSNDLMNFLLEYNYPGNYRELISMLEHIFIFAEDMACREHLSFLYDTSSTSADYQNLLNGEILELEQMIAIYIAKVYEKCMQNKTLAARKLGISVNTLKKYLSLNQRV